MPRFIVLIVVLLIALGGLYYLSTVPKAQPTRMIEADVQPGKNAG